IYFFFQAEDGIRDRNVTGVQTCALPISMALFATDPASPSAWKVFRFTLPPSLQQGTYDATVTAVESNGVLDVAESSALVRAPARSEERRVGKEWSARRAADG